MDHLNAIDWANRQTQITTSACRFNDRVHDLVAAQDGIGRADLEAQRAANAPCLVNDGHRHGPFGAIVWIEGQCWPSSDFGQNGNALKAPRRALVNGGVV